MIFIEIALEKLYFHHLRKQIFVDIHIQSFYMKTKVTIDIHVNEIFIQLVLRECEKTLKFDNQYCKVPSIYQ